MTAAPVLDTPRDRRHAPIVFASNVFAIIDDGYAQVDEYLEAERLILEEAPHHPGGLGCVVVIPSGVKPPPEAQRKAIEGTLTRLSKHLRGLVWVVEGSGFHAAAVRGVLVGLSLYGRRPYPTHVSSSLPDGLCWLGGKLGTSSGAPEIADAMGRIEDARARYGKRNETRA